MMLKNSWNAYLSSFELGERRYLETTLERYAHDMRVVNTPKTRRPAELAGKEFNTSFVTAVVFGKAGDVRYLIVVERTA